MQITEQQRKALLIQGSVSQHGSNSHFQNQREKELHSASPLTSSTIPLQTLQQLHSTHPNKEVIQEFQRRREKVMEGDEDQKRSEVVKDCTLIHNADVPSII